MDAGFGSFPAVHREDFSRRIGICGQTCSMFASRGLNIGNTTLKHYFSILFFVFFFSSPSGFARMPGSEPIHLDLEKLFLLSVAKENLDFRGKIEKNLPYKIFQNLKKNNIYIYIYVFVFLFCFVINRFIGLVGCWV